MTVEDVECLHPENRSLHAIFVISEFYYLGDEIKG